MIDNFKIKFDKETKKSLSIFFLIFGIFIVFIAVYDHFYGYEEGVKNILKEQYNLKVDSVYVNRDEHNFNYVAFSNGKQQILEFGYKKGDSLIKKKGDSIEYIYRENQQIKNNLLDILRFNIKRK